MNYNVLKDSIAAVIKANGNEEITGDLLQQVLLSMVNILGSGYQFMGAAVPTTNPGTPDARVFYIATQAGTYTNFGSPAIVLDGTQIAVLLFASSWTSVVLSVPTKEYVDTALALKVDKEDGKGLSTNDLTDALVALIGGAFQKEDIAQDLGDSTTKVVSQAAITAVLLQYAKVDGYYSQLTAGAAENLVGRGSVPASFLRRTTGGTADVGTGSAKIAKLMGNSIVWNQQVKNPNFVNNDNWGGGNGGTLSISDNIATLTKSAGESATYGTIAQPGHSFVNGHKFYVAFSCISNNTATKIRPYFGNNSFANYEVYSSWTRNAYIATGGGETTLLWRFFNQDDASSNISGSIRQVVVIDLTKMFGSGKEPTTAAELEALFPLPYYAYEPGKVLPFAAQKLVSTGFNQYNPETGKAQLIGGNKYQITGTYTAATIDGVSVTLDAEDCFTPDADCELVITGGNETDTCIHLVWSGYRNGEFEPYELHEAIFDPANWEDADGNKIFPYGGMHGVGTARDFATPDNDGFIRKATRIWDRRAYAAGDENNPAVITDGTTYTFVQLAVPVETELAEPVAVSYYANDFGTEEWQPANTDVPYTAPCNMNVAYAMNAVDTLRRLPENYISVGSFENFCTELSTKLGAALNKTITIAATYDSETEEYNYDITIADVGE